MDKDKQLFEKIREILKKEVRPFVASHGGDVELAEIIKDTVKVRFKGTCASCPVAQMTLRTVVEKAIKSKIPQIKKVEAICK